MKPHNSHECYAFAYKLSNVDTGINAYCNGAVIEQITIGCERDDEFYNVNGKPELTDRVMLDVDIDLGEIIGAAVSLDLEDILVFARKHCNGVYERVMREHEPDEVRYARK